MTEQLCSIADCDRAIYVAKLGYCTTHYSRYNRGTDLHAPVRPYVISDVARPKDIDDYDGWKAWMLARTEKQGDCLLMAGGHADRKSGYVYVKHKGKANRAHRLMASAKYRKPIDSLDSVHHSCSNRPCVNPDHLFEVTQKDNNIEMLERKAYQNRIAELEAALRELDPSHSLL